MMISSNLYTGTTATGSQKEILRFASQDTKNFLSTTSKSGMKKLSGRKTI